MNPLSSLLASLKNSFLRSRSSFLWGGLSALLSGAPVAVQGQVVVDLIITPDNAPITTREITPGRTNRLDIIVHNYGSEPLLGAALEFDLPQEMTITSAVNLQKQLDYRYPKDGYLLYKARLGPAIFVEDCFNKYVLDAVRNTVDERGARRFVQSTNGPINGEGGYFARCFFRSDIQRTSLQTIGVKNVHAYGPKGSLLRVVTQQQQIANLPEPRQQPVVMIQREKVGTGIYVTGLGGKLADVQRSLNLVGWTTLKVGERGVFLKYFDITGSHEILDTRTTNAPYAFYRAVKREGL